MARLSRQQSSFRQSQRQRRRRAVPSPSTRCRHQVSGVQATWHRHAEPGLLQRSQHPGICSPRRQRRSQEQPRHRLPPRPQVQAQARPSPSPEEPWLAPWWCCQHRAVLVDHLPSRRCPLHQEHPGQAQTLCLCLCLCLPAAQIPPQQARAGLEALGFHPRCLQHCQMPAPRRLGQMRHPPAPARRDPCPGRCPPCSARLAVPGARPRSLAPSPERAPWHPEPGSHCHLRRQAPARQAMPPPEQVSRWGALPESHAPRGRARGRVPRPSRRPRSS